MMIFGGDGEREPVSMVVSSKGTCFLLYHNTNKVLWSYDTNNNVYNEFHEKVEDYINANTHEDGNFYLHHCQGSSKVNLPIPWMPNEEIHAYLEWHFGDKIIFTHSERLVDLDFESGEVLDNSESNFVQIKMTDYIIGMPYPKWQLTFTRYEAICFEKKNSFGVHCLVHHARSPREFTSLCKKLKGFGLPNELTFEDIGLSYLLEKAERISRAKLDNVDESFNQSLESKGMYTGKYAGKVSAVVKKMDTISGIAGTYEKLWTLANHDSIVKFLGAEVDEGGHSQLLFAFEFVSTINLVSFLDTLVSHRDKYIGLMRNIVNGVRHIHEQKYSHGNLNPWNVLVSRIDDKPKLCGIIKCKKLPESKTKARRKERREIQNRDLRDLGQLISYCFCPSKFRRQYPTEAEYKASSGTFYRHIASNYREVEDIADKLVLNRSQLSQQAFEYIINHPWLWDAHKRLDFLRDVSDYMKQLAKQRDYYLKNLVDAIDLDLNNDDWDDTTSNKFNPGLVSHMKKYTSYNGQAVSSLVKFIRNLINHYEEITKALAPEDHLGESLEGLDSCLNARFPKLLIEIYKILETSQQMNKTLKRYFI